MYLNRPCTWLVSRPNRHLTQLLATGGVLQDLGMPTHLQGTNAKTAARFRHPNEAFYLTTDEEPYTVSIARQIQDETEEAQEATEEAQEATEEAQEATEED